MPMNVLPPSVPTDEWTKEKLVERVKCAMQVELSTIPLYLYAFYSIKPDSESKGAKPAGPEARFAIMSVVQQEMLHLALMGNILRAMDVAPELYVNDFIPTYPNKILSTMVPMSLTVAGRESFENFLRIEAPYYPAPASCTVSILPDEPSIGQFYENLKQGIEKVDDDGRLFENANAHLQFAGSDFFGANMLVIKDRGTALQAIGIITEQGEGGISSPDSHYQIFVDLYHRKQQWVCYDVVKDPQSDTYPHDSLVDYLALAFDAAYCYLLLSIELVWSTSDKQHRAHLIRNIHSIMMVVTTPLANLLVQQQFSCGEGKPEKNSAARFLYYPKGLDRLSIWDLHSAIQKRLEEAKEKSPQDSELHDSIDRIMYSVSTVAPFSSAPDSHSRA